MLAPAGTPRDILMKLNAEYNRIQVLPDVKEKLQAQGIDPHPGTPEQFAALIKSDMDTFAKVVKSLDDGKFKTVIGTIDFNKKGDVTLPGYVVYAWHNGKYAPAQ